LRRPFEEPVTSHAFFIWLRQTGAGTGLVAATMNLLIRLCFGALPHKDVNYFALQHRSCAPMTKDFTGELFVPQ
jgi:hypothetical protein